MCTTPGQPLDRVAEHGTTPRRAKVDGIHTSGRMDAAWARHDLDVEIIGRPSEARGFTPLPLRRRIGATVSTQFSHHRRPTRNPRQSTTTAENAVEIANFHRVPKACRRQAGCPT